MNARSKDTLITTIAGLLMGLAIWKVFEIVIFVVDKVKALF
jgi:hypothetical protein